MVWWIVRELFRCRRRAECARALLLAPVTNMWRGRGAAWALAVLAVLYALLAVLAQDLQIGVVEPSPARAQILAAASAAALEEAGVESLTVTVAPVEPDEPLALAAHVCEQAQEGASAVVGGGGARGALLAGEAAARAGLPLLLVDEAYADAAWETLALYPHPEVLAQVCASVCAAKGWSSGVLLHEGGPDGAALIAPDDKPLALLARRLPPESDAALLRNLLLVLKKSGATNFIVWCSAACSMRVLDAAQRVGLLAERHSYVMLALDLHTRALADYSHGGANITGFRLFDPEADAVVAIMKAWRSTYMQRLGAAAEADEAERVATSPPIALLLAYEGAAIAAAGLRHLNLPPMAPPECASGAGAFHADTLLNYLRSVEWGATSGGGAVWEADGARRDVQLQVVELQRGGRLQAQAVWAPSSGLAWQRVDPPAQPPSLDDMTNRTFTVLIAENSPYVMKHESTERLSGNDRYEGFCIELIDRLSKLLNFNYTFIEQPDGKYGTLNNVTNEWDGMIRRLMDDTSVHFAITDLTITAEREQAVDFTTPFMNLGISILFRKPKPPEPETFAFLKPFSNEVWLCLGFAYLGTSLLLYVVGRLCPEEWQNPYPCIEEPDALENQFTLANALWFNLGAVLLQGSEIAPIAYGTRAVASVWWVFALVITSSYTANLATILAKKSSNDLISNVQDLADNDLGISYGAKAGGATYTYFEHSKNALYQRIYEHMRDQKMPVNNDEGIEKVKKDNYAFLMESTTIEYTTERDCEVTKVGGLLDSKGYGIAMRKDSPYRQALNLALLNLQEGGVLREMKYKWWKEKHGGGACNKAEERESEELSMGNFLGLFLVLVVGCAFGIVLSCCDLAWTAAKHPRDPSQPYTRRFWEELRFVFDFERSVKPVVGPLRRESESRESNGPQDSEPSRTPRSNDGSGEEPAASGVARLRSPSLHSGANAWARRRSSMHAASVRLARHATRRSGTPNHHA